eukprot:7102457-Prymnesium_polylepis.1
MSDRRLGIAAHALSRGTETVQVPDQCGFKMNPVGLMLVARCYKHEFLQQQGPQCAMAQRSARRAKRCPADVPQKAYVLKRTAE